MIRAFLPIHQLSTPGFTPAAQKRPPGAASVTRGGQIYQHNLLTRINTSSPTSRAVLSHFGRHFISGDGVSEENLGIKILSAVGKNAGEQLKASAAAPPGVTARSNPTGLQLDAAEVILTHASTQQVPFLRRPTANQGQQPALEPEPGSQVPSPQKHFLSQNLNSTGGSSRGEICCRGGSVRVCVCERRCYFSLACFQRRSVETHRGQPDSLLIQDGRRVGDGLCLRCHIPSLRQWITPFSAQTGV